MLMTSFLVYNNLKPETKKIDQVENSLGFKNIHAVV